MLLIFLSGKTKITDNRTGLSPRNGSLIFYIIFILSCPLNPPANYLTPTREHKSKVTKQRCLQNIFLWFYENSCLSRLDRLRRLLSALRMICKEIAFCNPKLIDNWEQQGRRGWKGLQTNGRHGGVSSVCQWGIRLNWEPKEGQAWKVKKLSLLKLSNLVPFLKLIQSALDFHMYVNKGQNHY